MGWISIFRRPIARFSTSRLWIFSTIVGAAMGGSGWQGNTVSRHCGHRSYANYDLFFFCSCYNYTSGSKPCFLLLIACFESFVKTVLMLHAVHDDIDDNLKLLGKESELSMIALVFI